MAAPKPLIIVGAGPAGLSLAHHYKAQKIILERENEVGGLCRSFEVDGGVFDIGGHSFHTPHSEVEALVHDLMKGNWGVQTRDARVYVNGQLIPYPFQTHFRQIDDDRIVADCLAHHGSSGGEARNFEEWILARFGWGVAHHFMLPYNRKLWARDLRRIGCDWVSERIAGSVAPLPEGAAPKRKPLQSQSQVAYPARGGFVEIFRELAKTSGPIEFQCDVTGIDLEQRSVECRDGRSWHFDRLASTIPLPVLLDLMPATPSPLRARAHELEAVSLRVLMILVANSLTGAPQRVYLSDPAIPPHKVAFNHTSSLELRQRPQHAIMCEISHSAEKLLPPDDELEAKIVDWLIDARLVENRNDIALIRHFDAPFGYPVYTPQRSAILAEARAWLEDRGIWTFGRFGGWDYANSDECIRQGMELAARLQE